MRFCQRDQSPIGPQGVWQKSDSTQQGNDMSGRPAAVQMTEDERKKMLDEVEKQQQDFGIQ
jgi:hypothetical protein